MSKILNVIKEILKTNALLKYITVAFICLFTCSFLVLALAQQPTSDDLYNVSQWNSLGFYKYVNNHYNNWEGSYSQSILLVPITVFIVKYNAGFIYTLSVAVLFVAGIYFNIKVFLKNNQKYYVLGLIGMYILTTYFTSYKLLSQVFFWYTGNLSYFLPFIFLLFGFYFLKSSEKTQRIIGCVSLIIFAGFRISLNLELLIFAGIFFVGSNTQKITLNSLRNPIFYLILIILSCSIFYYMAPGNDVRMRSTGSAFLEGQNIKEKIVSLFGSDNFYKLINSITNLWDVLHYRSGIYPYFVTLIIALLLQLRNIEFKFRLRLAFLAYIFMFLGHVFLMYLIFGGSGPPRVLIFLILTRNFVLIIAFQSLLKKLTGFYVFRNIIILCIGVIMLKSSLYITKRAFQENIDYRKFYDNRVNEIHQQNNLDTLLLSPSPKWKFLYIDDNAWRWDPIFKGKQVIYKKIIF
jgi:hypothetical protein